jgi:hypothetical protein
MINRFVTISAAVCFLIAGNACAETFQVEHRHVWGGCKGKLVFTDTGIEYVTGKKAHARTWKYENIQQLELAPQSIVILTYNSRKVGLGADQTFKFKVLSGVLNEQFQKKIEGRLSRPLVSSILPDQQQLQFSIPVRHRLFLSDSQGLLEFGADQVAYRSGRQKDSRIWRYDELLSIGSTGPFQIRIGALEKTGGEYGEEKNYVFDLKRRLHPDEYDFIWNRINRPKIEAK